MIEARALTRRFGTFTAVSQLSFQVPSGSVLALLGPNGAGKTTTVRMLAGLLAPTEGEATVAGYDIMSPVETRGYGDHLCHAGSSPAAMKQFPAHHLYDQIGSSGQVEAGGWPLFPGRACWSVLACHRV